MKLILLIGGLFALKLLLFNEVTKPQAQTVLIEDIVREQTKKPIVEEHIYHEEFRSPYKSLYEPKEKTVKITDSTARKYKKPVIFTAIAGTIAGGSIISYELAKAYNKQVKNNRHYYYLDENAEKDEKYNDVKQKEDSDAFDDEWVRYIEKEENPFITDTLNDNPFIIDDNYKDDL
jgi:hypothetical protein